VSTTARVPHPSSSSNLLEHAKFVLEVLKDTASAFSDNEGYRLGAAFSYYATFSIFPLLLLAVTVVGFLVGDSAETRERLLGAITTPGSPIRDLLEKTLTSMQTHAHARGVSAVIGLATLLFGASGAFVELDAALNRIWSCPPRRYEGMLGTIRGYVLERLNGFAIVAFLGLTLLLSLLATSILSFVLQGVEARVDTPLWPVLARTAEVILSLALLSALFTAAFHFIPRKRPPVRTVIGGAVLITALFSLLKEIFTTYLVHLTSYSAYGIAGGVLALTTWIYVSSLILLFGAQLTRTYAEKIGVVRR
jgi:membrane protein